MNCPKCKTELVCPCKHCVKNRGESELIMWGWREDGETIYCPVCEFEAHADWWETNNLQKIIIFLT